MRLRDLLPEQETFTATNKKSGKTSVFKSKDARDNAIKAGTHEPIEKKGDEKSDKQKSPGKVSGKDMFQHSPDIKKDKEEPKKDNQEDWDGKTLPKTPAFSGDRETGYLSDITNTMDMYKSGKVNSSPEARDKYFKELENEVIWSFENFIHDAGYKKSDVDVDSLRKKVDELYKNVMGDEEYTEDTMGTKITPAQNQEIQNEIGRIAKEISQKIDNPTEHTRKEWDRNMPKNSDMFGEGDNQIDFDQKEFNDGEIWYQQSAEDINKEGSYDNFIGTTQRVYDEMRDWLRSNTNLDREEVSDMLSGLYGKTLKMQKDAERFDKLSAFHKREVEDEVGHLANLIGKKYKQPKPEPKPEPKSEPKSEPRTEPRPEPKPEPSPEEKARKELSGATALGFSDIEKLGSKAASDIDMAVRRDPNYTRGSRPGDDDRLRAKKAKELGYIDEVKSMKLIDLLPNLK